jgi:hypothetical protein
LLILEDKSTAQLTDAIIKEPDDWRGETLSRLRSLIKKADPAVVEEVKWKKPIDEAALKTLILEAVELNASKVGKR